MHFKYLKALDEHFLRRYKTPKIKRILKTNDTTITLMI